MLLLLGMAGFVLFLLPVLALRGHSPPSDVTLSVCFTAAFISLMLGAACNVVCKAQAEIIRLLKKQSGLPYGGEISSAIPVERYFCSDCGAMAEEFDGSATAKCPKCGVKFDADTAE